MSGKPPTDPGRSPRLGALDQIDFSRPPAGVAPTTPRARWHWLLPLALGLAMLAVLAILGFWREQIGQRLVPDSAINLQIEQAQLALARGELSKPDGSGALEQFQAVLARDPDHLAARAGLAQVRAAALAQARDALDTGNLPLARQQVELARALAAPAADLADLERALEQQQGRGKGVAGLLGRAREAQAQGQWEQVPDGALALYAQVLAQQPDNALALAGRRDILAALLQQAESALGAADIGLAQDLVARVVLADPSHLGLPELQARLGEALERQRTQREAALATADALRAQGQLEAAAQAYQALLAEAPAWPPAREGLDQCASLMAARAVRLAADFEFDAARTALDAARLWHPDSDAVARAEARLLQAEQARGQLPTAGADPAQLQALLAEASAAMRRGDLAEPPGDSAWDRLRQAQALAPRAAELDAAFSEFDRRARACFEDELASNRLARAQACLDARALRERDESLLALERRRLADRWLAFAEERLGANELALARRAWRSAQAVDPAHPGLAALAERLSRAGG